MYPGIENAFATLGYYEFRATVARESKTFRIYPDQVEVFHNWDTSIVWDRFPQHIHALTIHGIQDSRIPV